MLRVRGGRDLKGDRYFVLSVGDQVQAVAKPGFYLTPCVLGFVINPRRLMLAPVGIRVAGFSCLLCGYGRCNGC